MYRKTVISLVLGLAVSLTAAAGVQGLQIYDTGNVLVGANFNDGPGSSDMTLIMRLQSSAGIYADEGHAVTYIVDEQPSPGWTKVDYDDSSWEAGTSGVGFADGDDNVDVGSGKLFIVTRYMVDIAGAGTITNLELLADYDDQMAAWLNGELIVASAGVADLVTAGSEPAWDITSAGAPNHGSSEMAAGSPNEARWADGGIETTNITFSYGGSVAVEARGKLTTAWAALKTR
ncbi:hypothetical protein CMK11_15660 [Candidatus Poribacteria bacterium]|nr:hypothetical protein [Candidatus Poribacteria bacterium]